jgi:hypothetical protein
MNLAQQFRKLYGEWADTNLDSEKQEDALLKFVIDNGRAIELAMLTAECSSGDYSARFVQHLLDRHEALRSDLSRIVSHHPSTPGLYHDGVNGLLESAVGMATGAISCDDEWAGQFERKQA